MDWITGLSPCGPLGYNVIYTVVIRTTQAIRLTPYVLGAGEMSEEATAKLFFDGIIRHYGLPDEMLHDRDPRFTADFLDFFVESVGQQGCVSSAYHPQTDGRTELMHHTIE